MVGLDLQLHCSREYQLGQSRVFNRNAKTPLQNEKKNFLAQQSFLPIE